jgi:1-acylglycerone phosphate reductase
MTSEKQPKVVLITGCSKGGIGHALCEEYARKGCIVYATARRLETMQDLADAGMRTLRLDVTNNEDIKRVVDTVIEEQGRIDILVNNAGVSFSAPVIEQDLEQAKRLFDTNVWGVVALTQVVAPHMCRRRSGMIVNIGSIAGLAFLPWHCKLSFESI